jgi:BspA type Leucine rich repeat region (6 copies)
MKNTLFSLLGLILISAPLAATAQQLGDFTYSSDGSAITITGYTGLGGAVTIPDTISGLPVTTIGFEAFYNKSSLTSVMIPSSVTCIVDQAFWFCSSLTSVTIPGSVTYIGNYAFNSCTRLTTGVTIPGSVTNIGIAAFVNCASLIAITVDPTNADYSSADGVLFNKSLTMVIQCPGGKAGGYLIPDSVTSIGAYAFAFCFRLNSVTIPGSVTNIGLGAFADCESLTSITIPGSVTGITDEAFVECHHLQRVFFTGYAPSVGGPFVFSGAPATVYYLPGTTGWGTTFADRPTALWNPLMQSSGGGSAGFGFNITGTAGIPVVVEACANLANTSWVPLQSLTLTNGAFYFSDPGWTNYPARFYRIRSP